jgi:hypothetical protein
MSDWAASPQAGPRRPLVGSGFFDDLLAEGNSTSNDGPLRVTVRPKSLDERSRDLAIRTIWGEAAQEPEEGQAAVAAVIRNRMQAGRYGGSDVRSVVRHPNAFEPWNTPGASRAATGAGIGGAIGGAAPPVLAGLQGAAQLGGRAIEPLRNTLRGERGIDAEAARRVGAAVETDLRGMGSDAAGHLASIERARRSGVPIVNADIGAGQATADLVRSATNTSAEAHSAVKALADARFSGQSGRAQDFLAKLTGSSGDVAATREGLQETARVANKPAYDAAYRAPAAQAMWDEGFEQMLQAPAVQDAVRKAIITGKNDMARLGFTPIKESPFVMDSATGRLTLRTNSDGSQVLPSLQFWDIVKRNLDKSPEGRDWSRILRTHADELVPEYGKARAGAAAAFDAEDALEAGAKFVKNQMTAQEGARALAKMSSAERELFRQGFAARMIEDLSGVPDRMDVVKRIAQSDKARGKLQVALGEEGLGRIQAFTAVESTMDKLRGALGNSTTARQLYNLGIAGGGLYGGYGSYNLDPANVLQGAIAAGLSYRGRGVDARLSKRVAEMLTSNDPAVLVRGVKAVANSKTLSRAVLDFDRQLARVLGQQVASGDAGSAAIH